MPSGSPAAIDNTEVAGMLKRLYDNLSVDFFPQSNVLLANIGRAEQGGPYNMRWGGANVYYNAVVGSPVGLTSSPGGYLPPDTQRTEVQGNIDVERVYVRKQIDMKLIVGSTSKQMAYRTIGTKVVNEAKQAYRRGMARIAHGNATGKLATIGTVSSTTSIIVANPYGITSAGQGQLHLGVGQYIAVIDDTDGTTVLGRSYITALATTAGSDNCTVTLGTAVAGMAAGDYLVNATASDTSLNHEPNGLANISDSSVTVSLHNISATTYPETAPTKLTAGTDTPSALEISEEDFVELILKVAGRSGNDAQQNPDEFIAITTPGLFKKLGISFFGQRNWAMAPKVTLKGGFKAVEICGVPVVPDPMCPAGRVYLLHKPSLCWINARDFGAVTYNDAGVWRWVADRDAYETSWGEMMNFGAPQRNAIGSIVSYTDARRYTHVA